MPPQQQPKPAAASLPPFLSGKTMRKIKSAASRPARIAPSIQAKGACAFSTKKSAFHYKAGGRKGGFAARSGHRNALLAPQFALSAHRSALLVRHLARLVHSHGLGQYGLGENGLGKYSLGENGLAPLSTLSGLRAGLGQALRSRGPS